MAKGAGRVASRHADVVMACGSPHGLRIVPRNYGHRVRIARRVLAFIKLGELGGVMAAVKTPP